MFAIGNTKDEDILLEMWSEIWRKSTPPYIGHGPLGAPTSDANGFFGRAIMYADVEAYKLSLASLRDRLQTLRWRVWPRISDRLVPTAPPATTDTTLKSETDRRQVNAC